MALLLLEALAALAVLLLIVWWTMFSGRKNGEMVPTQDATDLDLAKTPLSTEKQTPASTDPS